VAGELVIPKRTNSASIATDSRRRYGLAVRRPWWWWASSQTIPLRRLSEWLAILDLQSTFVAYGRFTFGRTDWNGTSRNAEDVRPLSFTRPPSENFDRFMVLPRPTILAASRGSQAEAAGRMFSAMSNTLPNLEQIPVDFTRSKMPRGSKPGERRGGRQRGTPNKKTIGTPPFVRPLLIPIFRLAISCWGWCGIPTCLSPGSITARTTSGHRTQNSLDAYRNGVAADNTKKRPKSHARVSPKTETGELSE
jgi:hypothetical protein